MEMKKNSKQNSDDISSLENSNLNSKDIRQSECNFLNPPTLTTSHPIDSYPLITASARNISASFCTSTNTELLNNRSPASRMTRFFPSLFSFFTYVDFLDRPPRGFFFHPQGSS